MTIGVIDLHALEDRISMYFEVDPRQFTTAWVESPQAGRLTFTTLMSGGPVKEGDRVPSFYVTEFLAMEAWWQAFLAYLQHQPSGTVLWRSYPEMVEVTLRDELSGNMSLYYVRARLLILPHGAKVADA